MTAASECQITALLIEIAFSSSFNTIGTAAKVDGIEVSFHDLSFAHLFLKLESKIPFLELTFESLDGICFGTASKQFKLSVCW